MKTLSPGGRGEGEGDFKTNYQAQFTAQLTIGFWEILCAVPLLHDLRGLCGERFSAFPRK
jgi:hypothetical protein